jgi:hypothetical protein
VRLDLHEAIPSAAGPLVFHRGGNGYVDDGNVKYGELLASDLAGPLPPVTPSSGGRGAACALAPEPPSQVHVRSIPGRMRYKPPPNRGTSFSHYGDPAADQGDRDDVHYTYLLWSFLDVQGGGTVRVLLRPDQYVWPCDVAPVTTSSWDADGNLNGQVTARYVRLLAGSCPLYGWTVWSHKYLDHAAVAHTTPAAAPPPADPQPDPTCPVAAPASPPQVTTTAARVAAGGSWAGTGTVNPVGVPARYHFDYGADPSRYTAASPDVSIGATDRAVPVASELPGLVTGAVYHYRLVASSVHGTSFGADQAFTATGVPARRAPVALSGLRVAPRAFRRARSRRRAPARIRYRLSARARVTLRFERAKLGVRRKDGCHSAPRRRLPAGTPRCVRWAPVRGSLHGTHARGRASVRFAGWLGRRPLARGRYRVAASPRASDGKRGRTAHAGFRIR